MDDDDRKLLERSIRHAMESHSGAALDAALGELGWPEALSMDPRTAVSLLFELQGATHANTSAMGALLSSALGPEAGGGAGVVMPRLSQWDVPGRMVEGDLVIRGLGTASLVDGAVASVVARIDGTDLALEVSTADLTFRAVRGMDPSLGLVEIAGDSVPCSTRRELPPNAWPEAVALARIAAGHELVGAGRAVLELARGHALERVQFGRPISSFQAIRHRLADTLVALEAAAAALDSAWEVRSTLAAAMAKAQAGRGARTAARHCQQVLAGIGFTTEHDFHLYVRRILVLNELFGSARGLTRNLGDELLATRKLPPLPPL